MMQDGRYLYLFLLGKPASGKGTQIRRVLETFEGTSFSTGDALKDHIARGTELGKRVKSLIESGALVSDDIVMALFKDSAQRLVPVKGRALFLVDGFPRTIGQYEMVRTYLCEQDASYSFVYFSIDDEVILRRFAGRLVCDACFSPFSTLSSSLKEKDTCPLCKKGALIRRADDNEAVVRNRLAEYRRSTAPMVTHIADTEKGYFAEVDGACSVDETFTEVRSLLEKQRIALKQ